MSYRRLASFHDTGAFSSDLPDFFPRPLCRRKCSRISPFSAIRAPVCAQLRIRRRAEASYVILWYFPRSTIVCGISNDLYFIEIFFSPLSNKSQRVNPLQGSRTVSFIRWLIESLKANIAGYMRKHGNHFWKSGWELCSFFLPIRY